MTVLSDEEIAGRLKELDGWRRDGDSIVKTYERASFGAAVAFVVAVGYEAEAFHHHPDMLIQYRQVTLTLSTHEAGGLTAKDFRLAESVEALA